MALDEATTALLAQMAALGGQPLHQMQPAEARAMPVPPGPAGPEMVRVEQDTLPTADGSSFRVRTLVPTESPAGIFVYIHGGGWVLGDIDRYDTVGRRLAAGTNCAVVMVDYRKAPEAPFPAAVEDSWQALRWAADSMERIAGRQVPLIVGGDSAGGNLSAVMTLRARDAGGPQIDLQVLIYPVTDADLDTASYLDPQNQLMLSKETMIWFWDHYADTTQRFSLDAAPLRAESLAGLPPTISLVAEHDVLRSEGEAYAAALEAAGVTVEHRMFEGQMHGFFQMVDVLPGAGAGMQYVVDGVNRHLGRTPDSTTAPTAAASAG
ncbi:alpha/beta hydrolase [Nakamurella leprariae]|uniref:Alpha/beta hydrolase n=1 Tax=Nakamurella leprariae TaxID=2803911 RepID=A0A938YAX4_9ACTN|nr:alpha/beta hydrolase [Nakamurella leprariae]MBM9466429.1 alpha/beta hydrolase [Nakamurella leprariae]